MAQYAQSCGERYIATDSGIGWAKNAKGRWSTELFGVTYELEKRRRHAGDAPDTGYYLYSAGADCGNFFGEWCARRLLDAAEEAAKLINATDLRMRLGCIRCDG